MSKPEDARSVPESSYLIRVDVEVALLILSAIRVIVVIPLILMLLLTIFTILT